MSIAQNRSQLIKETGPHRVLYFLGPLVIAALASVASAQEARAPCSSVVRDEAIKSTVATAGFWANMFEKRGSIKFESNAIFLEAQRRVDARVLPESFCPKGCAVAPKGVLVFRSTPRKVLSDYEEAEHCQLLQNETSRRPLVYTKRDIRSIEQLGDWVGDLSRGRGEDGEDLYAACDGSCSPRFEYRVSKNEAPEGSRTVTASVICGAARDKDDNTYQLDAFFRWSCE